MSATIIQFPDPTTRRSTGGQLTATSAAAAPDPRVLCADGLDGQTEVEWFRTADAVLDQIEALLDQRRAQEVITLCESGMWCLLDAAPDIDDWELVMMLLDRLRDLHLRACCAERPEPSRLADFLYRLATAHDMHVVDGVIDPYRSLLGPVGFAQIRRLLADEDRRNRHLTDIRRSILEFRLRPIHASLARCDHPSAM